MINALMVNKNDVEKTTTHTHTRVTDSCTLNCNFLSVFKGFKPCFLQITFNPRNRKPSVLSSVLSCILIGQYVVSLATF